MKKLFIVLSLLFVFSCNNNNLKQEKKDNIKTEVKEKSKKKKEIKKEITKKEVVKKEPKKDSKVFMWKLTSHNKNINILGSVHLAKSDLYPLDTRITNAYQKSDNLVVEANIKKDMLKVQMESAKMSFYQKGSLKEDLNDEKLYKELLEKASSVGLNEFIVNKTKLFIVPVLLITTKLGRYGYNSMLGIDMHFLNKAEKDKKKILELEDAMSQLKMLSSFSKEINVENLKITLRDWDKAKEMFEKLFNSWRNGDSKKIEEITTKDEENKLMKSYLEKILYDRNIKMVKKIEEYAKSKENFFIVVGSGHLVGKKGIVEVLKSKGYKLEQQ